MPPTPATSDAQAHLLGIAALAQQSLDLNDPAAFWYRQGARDAHAYAAALLATGGPGELTQATADRLIQLLGEGVADVDVLLDATETPPRPGGDLTWMGQLAFDRLAVAYPGIDHDLGSQWGPRRDLRISHRLTSGASTGLLYAHDRTWEEYAILAPAAPVEAVTATFHAALEADPHLPLTDFLRLLHQHSAAVEAQPDSAGVQL